MKVLKFNFLVTIGGKKMESNKVICKKENYHFTKGKEYECTPAYAKWKCGCRYS